MSDHCDPLCCGNDKNPHGCGTAMWDQGECVGCRERAATVKWLTARRDIFASGIWFAREIENGTHLAGDDE